MPTRSELLEHYEKISGLSTENIDYYLVLANWKLGIVLEKTYAAGVRTGKVDPKITETLRVDDPAADRHRGRARPVTANKGTLKWVMRTSFSTSPIGSCSSPAAAADWAAKWRSPSRAAAPTW